MRHNRYRGLEAVVPLGAHGGGRSTATTTLRSCPALRTWRPEEFVALARLSTLADVGAGCLIASTTDRVQPFILVVEGEAAIFGPRGASRIRPGDVWGADTLLGAASECETVIARTRSRLAVVGPGEFHALLRTLPAFAELVARDLARRTMPLTVSDRARSS